MRLKVHNDFVCSWKQEPCPNCEWILNSLLLICPSCSQFVRLFFKIAHSLTMRPKQFNIIEMALDGMHAMHLYFLQSLDGVFSLMATQMLQKEQDIQPAVTLKLKGWFANPSNKWAIGLMSNRYSCAIFFFCPIDVCIKCLHALRMTTLESPSKKCSATSIGSQ